MCVNDGTVPDLPQQWLLQRLEFKSLILLVQNWKKTKKGRLMKRLKNVQKMKTVEKAIAMNEKYAEKSSKIKSVYVMFS
ncbi:hypothetical protein E1A91_A01G071200v1 [Gossypium mustelinum]|uniref:Uncharacterized protein n=1 Tax=Gossypium mustelinum TaxID=34275 RepID=A0A5D3AEP4_GOSMU|nr:hypothetical protein E1A91_A01G071200v1 [Gossypium mustelinum]TYJ48561.1 hypothetical protein E1A91_A01G071200v1 [Gossypium mustelinum]